MEYNDLLTGFYFNVKVDGSSSDADASFQEVHGLYKEMNIEEVNTNDENHSTYRLPSTAKCPNLILRRGIASTNSELIAWCQNTIDCDLDKPIQTKNISLTLTNENGESCMSWRFVKAYPIKYSVADLKSTENSILLEILEFSYQCFEVETSPVKESKLKSRR
ncbi:phage tail protein [Undibacterium fentianense]|uniref:Phage tail protein n=1 Tax=Undibacterium fentianense TaxID=2828728 RepID=A0A941IGZ7_9BURK|nr:phage tail protein [Undibacterium fentianense]MBR7800490.1 phage tail protein [Undibacterium fentianense]